MKHIKLLFLILLFSSLSYAQLNPGDIAFVQYNADGIDDFAFVTLVDIPAGEVINFTDNEENDLGGGEGTITWTAPVSGVSCGTIITVTSAPSTTLGTATEVGGLNFAGAGDSIIAYQGTIATPTFIAALNNEGAGGGVFGGANGTNLPTGLTNATDALDLQEIDNAIYNGAVLSGTKAVILAAINDFNNWSGDNTTNQTFSGVFTVSDCASTTAVEFVSTTSTITENGASINVCVAIANPDASNATTVEIDLDATSTATNGTDYNDGTGAFTFPLTFTFPAGSSANQCFTIFISDDAIFETSETVILNLQNVSGGNAASLGSNTQHTLTITDDDLGTCNSIFSDDFSAGLTQWNNTTDWTTVADELKHNLSGTAGISTINANIGLQNLDSGNYEWSLCMRNGSWDPSGGNNFSYVLISDNDDTSNNSTGYRLGINHISSETDDLLKLYSVNNGVDTVILTTAFDWDADDDVCIRVTRTYTGDWELLYDDGTGEVSGGVVNDTNYNTGSYVSLFFEYTSTRAGELWVDDVAICKAPINCATTSTWNGTAWTPSAPDANTNAIINGNYNTNTAGQDSFSACSLTINAGFNLTIAPTNYVEVIGDVTNNGRILIQDQGSFVQIEDSASYDDTGSAFFATDNTSQVTRNTAPINDWFEYTYWSSPVANEMVEDALFTANPDRRFYFNAANFEDSTYEVGNNNSATAYLAGDVLDDIDDDGNDWQYASGLMIPGVGYAATLSTVSFSFGTAGDNFAHVFEGTLNNGDINVPVVRNDGSNSSSALPDNNWNFIGNPYPSAIDVDVFLTLNRWTSSNTAATLDGSIYLWSQNAAPSATSNGNQVENFSGADYAVINGIGETAGGDGIVPTRHISSAQGFFVNFVDTAIRASSTGTVTFKNAMRVRDNNTQFLRTNTETIESEFEKLRLNLTSDNGVFSQLFIGYNTQATNDFDGSFYDTAKNSASNNPVKFGSSINNNPNIYAIQGRNISTLDTNEIIPIAFSTSIDVATIYTISIADFEGNFMSNNAIYLKDNIANTYQDLTLSNYSFTSELGEFNDRFEIVFTQPSLSVGQIFLEDNLLSIIETTNDNVTFKVSTTNNLTIKKVKIYDALGRLIYNLKGNNSTETYNLSNLNQAPFVANIELSNGQLIKKKAIKK